MICQALRLLPVGFISFWNTGVEKPIFADGIWSATESESPDIT